MFNGVHLVMEDVIKNRLPNGWYQLKLDYFQSHPEVIRTAADRLNSAPLAKDRIAKRYSTLNKDSRPIGKCPRRGVAVRRRDNAFLFSWMHYLAQKFEEHYGDTIGADCGHDATAELINHFACGKHEEFQSRKMGLFAPYAKGSLIKSVSDFITIGYGDNDQSIPVDLTDLALEVFDQVREIDLGGIEDGSLVAVPSEVAVYESNVQGLATGVIQLARDQFLSKEKCKELKKLYGYDFNTNKILADQLIGYYNNVIEPFDLSKNIVTNLKRVQVGGLDIDLETLINQGPGVNNVKKAKYRTINTNDPIIQIAEAQVSIPFREAVKHKTECVFYNTLLDPDNRVERIKSSLLYGEGIGVTQFPFDFEIHDAHQHAEWMFNLMQRVVKPKFRREDWDLVDISTLALVFKIIMQPVDNKGSFRLTPLIGSLGSGDPWTNGYGTLGTRSIARLLARVRPDIFFVDVQVGFNNGDDTSVGVYTEAIKMYGIDEIIRIANEIVNPFHYFFNGSKLISILLPGNHFATHWEQYAYWYNIQSREVLRHGSTLRYFGKVYVAEDAGRETALEGLIDQHSTLNNTIGYIGDQRFLTTTLNIEVLIEFIKRDDVLMSYLNQYGEAYFSHITDDAIVDILDKLKRQREAEGANGKYFGLKDDELRQIAKDKLSKHLHIAGYDRDQVTRVIHDKDFSFFGISKLVGLGLAELTRMASVGKGRMIQFSIIDGKLKWQPLDSLVA